jgi:AraC family transcriptional regulator
VSHSFQIGHFYGSVANRWSSGPVVVNRLVHRHGLRPPAHAHEAGYICMMLRGQYKETAARTHFDYQPFTCVYHPPGMEHADEIGRNGVTFITFEFKPRLFEGLEDGKADLRPLRDLSATRPAWELFHLYRQLAAGECSQFDLECRATELASSVVRAPSRIGRDLLTLRRACDYARANFRESITLAQTAAAVAVHPVYLGALFRREMDETFGEFVNRLRVQSAADDLAVTDQPLTDVALRHGFYDQSHFIRTFRRMTGVAPGAFRRSLGAGKFQLAS